MNNLHFERIGLVIQSFAIFAALSTVLGRIYFLTYFRTLGIPTSEMRLSITDYSIISPDTAILGVGMVIAAPVLLWFARLDSSTTTRPNRIAIGLGIILLAMGFVALDTMVFTNQAFRPGLLGIGKLVPLVISMTGAAVIASGFSMPSGDDIKTAKNAPKNYEVVKMYRAWRLLLSITIVIYVMVLFAFTSYYAMIIGRLDAESLLQNTPSANVEFISSNSLALIRHDAGICPEDSLSCDFKVLLIGDNFVYLKPLKSDLPEGNRIYAFPPTDIASISYALDE